MKTSKTFILSFITKVKLISISRTLKFKVFAKVYINYPIWILSINYMGNKCKVTSTRYKIYTFNVIIIQIALNYYYHLYSLS